ncbi:MAG: zf-TFIIB domain-containing protein, partial [Bdellovibrionales bacterium]|nr:zf-TFIIB domain-containing protein [Bdellovibrionales bacterium]
MKCPGCANNLQQMETGPIRVDFCEGGCQGIWFDPGELEKCDE